MWRRVNPLTALKQQKRTTLAWLQCNTYDLLMTCVSAVHQINHLNRRDGHFFMCSYSNTVAEKIILYVKNITNSPSTVRAHHKRKGIKHLERLTSQHNTRKPTKGKHNYKHIHNHESGVKRSKVPQTRDHLPSPPLEIIYLVLVITSEHGHDCSLLHYI